MDAGLPFGALQAGGDGSKMVAGHAGKDPVQRVLLLKYPGQRGTIPILDRAMIACQFVEPDYGRFDLDMNDRIDFERRAA